MKALAVLLGILCASLPGLARGADEKADRPPVQTFSNPPELAPDSSGVYQLHFGPTEHVIDGQRYCLRAYNGMVPGPTIRVPKGTGADRRVRIDLHNDFTKADYREVVGFEGLGDVTCHDFNLTNLHAHGSHIRPDYAVYDAADPCSGKGCGPDQRYFADNVLHHVEFGETAKFRWDLDEDGTHRAGLDWYHPHIHGSTAIQVTNGAAGVWIVEGDVDKIRGIAGSKERIIIVNHIPYDSEYATPLTEGQSCTEDTLSLNNFLTVEHASPMLVNGKRKPRIVTPPNQVERWRILHAGTPDEMILTLHPGLDPDCQALNVSTRIPMTQIGADGSILSQPYTRDSTFMAAGYRVESMVKMPATRQTLCLTATRSDVPTTPVPDDVILIVTVDPRAGAATTEVMPSAVTLGNLAPPTTWMGRVNGQEQVVSCDTVKTIHQKVVLLVPRPAGSSSPSHHHHGSRPASTGPKPTKPTRPTGSGDGGTCDPNAPGPALTANCDCPEPNISCRKFDERRELGYDTDRVMTVGDSERWRLQAADGHPFHIHTNHFVVCPGGPNSKEPPFAHWRDTYFALADDPARDLLMEFRKFTGRFTLHCHKLNHEDEGMMELVEICAPGDLDCLCLENDGTKCTVPKSGCTEDDLQCQYAAQATTLFPAPAACTPTRPQPERRTMSRSHD